MLTLSKQSAICAAVLLGRTGSIAMFNAKIKLMKPDRPPWIVLIIFQPRIHDSADCTVTTVKAQALVLPRWALLKT